MEHDQAENPLTEDILSNKSSLKVLPNKSCQENQAEEVVFEKVVAEKSSRKKSYGKSPMEKVL